MFESMHLQAKTLRMRHTSPTVIACSCVNVLTLHSINTMTAPTETKRNAESLQREHPAGSLAEPIASSTLPKGLRNSFSVPFRRMRGAMGLALFWGAIWVSVGVGARVLTFAWFGAIGGWSALVNAILSGVKYGIIGGVAQGILFAGILRVTQRNAHRIESLSWWRTGLGGATVAIFVNAVLGGGLVLDGLGALSGALGAIAAVATLHLARREDSVANSG